jgi:thiol-disulfide isomerase/thioredoxin
MRTWPGRVGPRTGALSLLVGGALLTAVAWAWLARADPSAEPIEARVGARAPQAALPMLAGGTARLSEERGKVVVLNFWATWCVPCRAEMPELQRLADDFRGEPFALWAINLQEDPASIQEFQRELGLRLSVLLDEEGEVTRAFSVRALPATFLVDQQGVLRQQRLGPLIEGDADNPWSRAWLARQVRDLLRT